MWALSEPKFYKLTRILVVGVVHESQKHFVKFYDFSIAVCLKDSVLAFHEHGMQGKSFKQNKVTQEILDGQRTYKLVGADRYVSHLLKPTQAKRTVYLEHG